MHKDAETGLYKEVKDKMHVVTDCQGSQDKIRNDNWAIICDTVSMRLIMHEDFSKDAVCEFYIAKEPLYTVSLSLAFPKKSPLKEVFDIW